MSKLLKHTIDDDGLVIQLRWYDFRKKHGIDWKRIQDRNGDIRHIPTWPVDCLAFIKDNKITYKLKGNGNFAKTPDGRTVEMKDIIFIFPSKDLTALFKLSYL